MGSGEDMAVLWGGGCKRRSLGYESKVVKYLWNGKDTGKMGGEYMDKVIEMGEQR